MHLLFSIFFGTCIHRRAVCGLMLMLTKMDTKTVIFITTNLIKLYLMAYKHYVKKASTQPPPPPPALDSIPLYVPIFFLS